MGNEQVSTKREHNTSVKEKTPTEDDGSSFAQDQNKVESLQVHTAHGNNVSADQSNGKSTPFDQGQMLHQSLTISSVSNVCWYFHAQIQDLKLSLLFDTGSPVSIISMETYNKMSADKPSLNKTDSNSLAANGTKLEIFGQANFRF